MITLPPTLNINTVRVRKKSRIVGIRHPEQLHFYASMRNMQRWSLPGHSGEGIPKLRHHNQEGSLPPISQSGLSYGWYMKKDLPGKPEQSSRFLMEDMILQVPRLLFVMSSPPREPLQALSLHTFHRYIQMDLFRRTFYVCFACNS